MGMYDLNILLKLKENNISINKYILLKIIEDCSLSLFKEEYLQELVNLKLEGILNAELELTTKGMELLQSIEEKKTKSIDYDKLHLTLQNKLLSLKGKKQIEGFGGVYFIPNKTELKEFLTRFWNKYPKYKDLDKISKILQKHIETCSKKNSFAPAIKYYIYKQGVGSQLASAIENYEEQELETKQTFDGINI